MYFWDNEPKQFIRGDKMFYEWEFNVPNFYDSYLTQERYILGIRHMHFRVMRIVHDACGNMVM